MTSKIFLELILCSTVFLRVVERDSDGSRAAPGLPPAVWDWADITVSDGRWGEGKCLLVTATG